MKKLIVIAALLLAPLTLIAGTWNGTIYQLIPTGQNTTVTGATFTLDFPYDKHTWCTTIAGASSVSVTFQGSLDNSLWATLDTSTSASSECRHVVNKPVKYVRSVVGTLDAGTIKVQSLHMN
jgi:hypothetical protein